MCLAPDRNIWTSLPDRGKSRAKTQDVEAGFATGFARFATGVAKVSRGPRDGQRRCAPDEKGRPEGRPIILCI